MLAQVLSALAVISLHGSVPFDDPGEDCFQQLCTAVFVWSGGGTPPPGVTFSFVPQPEINGEGTFTCATCPNKPCRAPVDVVFDPGPSNAFFISIDGRIITGPFNDTVVAKRNCLQDEGVELDVTLFDLDNEWQMSAGGYLHCLCTPLPD
jgi:hypothetical protein